MKVEENRFMKTYTEQVDRRLQNCKESDPSGEEWLRTQEYLEDLKKKLGGMEIRIGDPLEGGVNSYVEYAKSNRGSFHVLISEDVLKRMMEDEEFARQCEESLIGARKELFEKAKRYQAAGRLMLGGGVILGKDGDTVRWTVGQDPKKDERPWFLPVTAGRKDDGSITRIRTKEGTITIKRTLSYRPAKDLARIAGAPNQRAVKSAMSGIHAQIHMLKSAKGDKQVKRQLVHQAEQVLQKARIKISNLKKEELLEVMQKRAEAKEKIRKAAYLKRLLNEKRCKRRVREYGQIRDYYPVPGRRRDEREDEYKEHDFTDGIGSQIYGPSGSSVTVSTAAAGAGPMGDGTGIFVDISL